MGGQLISKQNHKIRQLQSNDDITIKSFGNSTFRKRTHIKEIQITNNQSLHAYDDTSGTIIINNY